MLQNRSAGIVLSTPREFRDEWHTEFPVDLRAEHSQSHSNQCRTEHAGRRNRQPTEFALDAWNAAASGVNAGKATCRVDAGRGIRRTPGEKRHANEAARVLECNAYTTSQNYNRIHNFPFTDLTDN
jgi:hypothetical protein